MKRLEVTNYLNNLGLKHPEVCIMDAYFGPLKQILFPHGYLLFSNDDKIDQLFINQNEGFHYAVALLSYYFGSDTPEFNSDFAYPYQAIIVNTVRYTELSPALFDNLAIYKFATLERNETTEEDPRLEHISFDSDENILNDMINNQ